jgi:hypothetical protein
METVPPNPSSTPSLDERRFEQDMAAKNRELDLKEREIAIKEREVAAREVEVHRSRWLNPTTIGLFAAAIGLIGNVLVARVSNQNTQQVEHVRAQSNLVLEAIKTGTGNTNDACKNLIFLVQSGLLEDGSETIRKQCASAPIGPPSLPSGQLTPVRLPGQNPFYVKFGELDARQLETVEGVLGKYSVPSISNRSGDGGVTYLNTMTVDDDTAKKLGEALRKANVPFEIVKLE